MKSVRAPRWRPHPVRRHGPMAQGRAPAPWWTPAHGRGSPPHGRGRAHARRRRVRRVRGGHSSPRLVTIEHLHTAHYPQSHACGPPWHSPSLSSPQASPLAFRGSAQLLRVYEIGSFGSRL